MDTDALKRAIHDAGGLASVADLARLWEVSEQRAHQVVRHADFPTPAGFTSNGRYPVWFIGEAQAFRAIKRRPGRKT